MIAFLLMNCIVGASSFLLVYKILRLNNFIDSLLALFILYFAQIVFSELLLGISGALYLGNVIFLNLIIFLVIWVVCRNKKYPLGFPGSRKVSDDILINKVTLLAIAVILSFGLVKAFINLTNPPFGWDCLNYHFTFPVEWLKHGNLETPITVFDDPAPPYYPINGSLFYLWLILPFKNVFLADLGQIPFFILASLATYNIAIKIGLDKKLSFYATALFLLIPNFFKQLQIAYVDVMVAGLFLVCVNFLFLLNEKLSWVNTLIYSISLALLLGTKTVALPYCILLIIPFIYLLFKAGNLKKMPGLAVIFILAVVIWGSFTYIRNFMDTANPLYPLDVKLFGFNLFRGVIDKNVYGAHFKIEDYSLAKVLFHEGLGIQTIIFILPAIFLALPAAFIKNKRPLNFNLIYFLILPLLIYLAYRYIIPLANTRYLYPLLGTGMVAGFYTVKILNIPKRIIDILVAVCILASMSELAKRQELIISIIAVFLLFISLPFLIRYIKQKGFIKKPAFIFTFLAVIILSPAALETHYVKNEYPAYIKMVKYSGFWPDAVRAWDWLNSNTTGNNIAYVGRPVPFPLYGTKFKNNVYYVSVNKTEPVKLHYFTNSYYQWDNDFLNLHKNLEVKGNYRSEADYSAWLDNLSRRNTDYLFIYSLHQTKNIIFPLEDNWAGSHPQRFAPVFANKTIKIYKILR